MNREKEIQKIAEAIEKIKGPSDDNSVWPQITAGYLFAAGCCDIDTFAQKIFEKTEKYIEKWRSRAEEEKDKDYAWGMRYVCDSSKSKLDDIKKEYEDEKLIEAISNERPEEKEKSFKKMVKIIHSCLCNSELPEDTLCSDCEELAESLLLSGFQNYFLFLSSFFSKTRKYLEEERGRVKDQVDEYKDDAQYLVGKMFVFGRLERKIENLEREWEEKKISSEMPEATENEDWELQDGASYA